MKKIGILLGSFYCTVYPMNIVGAPTLLLAIADRKRFLCVCAREGVVHNVEADSCIFWIEGVLGV